MPANQGGAGKPCASAWLMFKERMQVYVGRNIMQLFKKDGAEAKVSRVWLLFLSALLFKSAVVLFSLYPFCPKQVVFGFSLLNIAPLLFLISFSFWFYPKSEYLCLFIMNIFLSILFFADLLYARAFGHPISFYTIFARNVTEDLGPGILSLVKTGDLLLILDFPLFLFLYSVTDFKKRMRKKSFYFYITFVLSLVLICYQFIDLESKQMLGNYRQRALLMSPVGCHMFDLYRFVYEKTDRLDSDELRKIDEWLIANAGYQEAKEENKGLEGILKGKNIIVVQFESLENFVIKESFLGQEITPNINKIVDKSIFFTNIVEQVRDGNSSDAELLFNASVYPVSRGSAFLRFGDNRYNTLPMLLKEKGYTSVAIHGDDKTFWNRDHVFPLLGFDGYIDQERFSDKTKVGMGIVDESLFRQSIAEIKGLYEPYLFFIITLTSHMPFVLKADDRGLDLPAGGMGSAYLQSIHYSDKMFGRFYEQLENEGMLENTALVIYGDHEGVHRYYETTLPDNNRKIPFIVHLPGMEGIVIEKLGGQVDMMPTLAFLMGIETEKYACSVMGRNLFGKYSGSAILSTGEVLPGVDNGEHLRKGLEIADLYVRGNYYFLNDK